MAGPAWDAVKANTGLMFLNPRAANLVNFCNVREFLRMFLALDPCATYKSPVPCITFGPLPPLSSSWVFRPTPPAPRPVVVDGSLCSTGSYYHLAFRPSSLLTPLSRSYAQNAIMLSRKVKKSGL